jgi:hypothetical protein
VTQTSSGHSEVMSMTQSEHGRPSELEKSATRNERDAGPCTRPVTTSRPTTRATASDFVQFDWDALRQDALHHTEPMTASDFVQIDWDALRDSPGD